MTDTERLDTEKPDTERPEAKRPGGAPGVPSPPVAPAPARPHANPTSLLPQDERDKLTLRIQHAVTGFVDGPQASVEEADRVLEEVSARFTEALARGRRTLRQSWQSADDGDTGETERLRLALRDYRELAERLLRI